MRPPTTSSVGALALAFQTNKPRRGRTTVVEDVGVWVSKLRYEDLTPQAIQKAKRVLLDTQDFKGEITAREHADHSVPYVIARALLDGQVKVDEFEERRFREPRAVALYKKVTLRADPSLSGPGREAYGVKMEVRLRNGSVLREELAAPPGSLENPADEAILGKKFLALSENVLGKVRAQKAIDVIVSVERMPNLKDLLSAVSR